MVPDAASESRNSPPGREVWVVFCVALAVRIVALWVLDDPCEIGGKETSWDWGYEQAAVAQSLARGDGLADPFARGTGPTAWCAPAYPALLALLIELFGGIDRSMATALALLQSVLAAATCVALWRLGERSGGRRLGRPPGWAWALHPAAIYYAVNLAWDSTLSAFGVTCYLAALVASGPRASVARSAALGLGFGALMLINPAPVALLPVVLGYACLARASRGEAARVAVAFLAGASLTAGPWMLRNRIRVGSLGIRSNLGVELRVGNTDRAEGRFDGPTHPAYDPAEFARYVELGEHAYSSDSLRRFRAWVAEHPGRFVRLCGVRVQRFWVGPNPFEEERLGSGERRRRDWMGWVEWLGHAGGGLLAVLGALLYRGPPALALLLRGTLLLFPLVYYVTHVFERYRFPIEPVVVLLAAYVVLAARDRWLASCHAVRRGARDTTTPKAS